MQTTYFFPSEHGLIIYWHIGNNKKANATVAITAIRKNTLALVLEILQKSQQAILSNNSVSRSRDFECLLRRRAREIIGNYGPKPHSNSLERITTLNYKIMPKITRY